MMKNFFLWVLSVAGLLSCSDDEVATRNASLSTPSCVLEKIEALQKEAVRNPPAAVYQYQYHGESVYYFTPFCCDIPSELYDQHCNLMCYPDGGYTNTPSGCEDFINTRSNEKLIWKDNRQ